MLVGALMALLALTATFFCSWAKVTRRKGETVSQRQQLK